MDDSTKQALLSALRSIMMVAGAALASHGIIKAEDVNMLVGALITVIPIVWGIVDKYIADRKTKDKEIAAVNAGVALAQTTTVGPTVRSSDVPQIIKDFAPSPAATSEIKDKP